MSSELAVETPDLEAEARHAFLPDSPFRLAPETPETPPSLGVIVYNRLAFGPRPGDLAAFQALGADDGARLAAWLAEQLSPTPDPAWVPGQPDPYLDAAYKAKRDAAGFATLGKTLQQQWVDHQVGGLTPSRPADETRLVTLMRMTYSRWQLHEVLADFWMNHFNVYAFESPNRSVFVHYDRDAIRPHLTGNFRDMLEAVAKSTAMLYYLDNYTNTRSGPNENWARELFELGTLGAENYYGVQPQANVPQEGVWPPGLPGAGMARPAGYVDADVYEAARCFTGWGVNTATGLYAYNDSNHDRFQKAVLSKGMINLPADQPAERDGQDVLDLLASHPGTGRYVVRKLCRRLVADDPPASLVDPVAALFTSLWQAPDQLRQVVEAIVLAPEFSDAWGGKSKRPVEYVVAAMRAVDANWFFGYSAQDPLTIEADTSSLLFRLSRAGHTLFNRIPPDGFPDHRQAWSGSNSRVQCWRLAGWLVDQDIDGVSGTDDFRLDVIGQTVASPARSPNQIADFWIDRLFGRPLATADRAAVVAFMADGGGLDTPLDLTVSAVKRRLRSLYALLLMLPDFLIK